MRFSRPSVGTLLGGLALFVALGGTTLAATGQLVNIADPGNAANVAHVDTSGKLEVGDGTGPLTVDGTVVTQQASPSNYFHAARLPITSSSSCVTLATPPSGKALIIRDVKIDVFEDPSPGTGQFVTLYKSTPGVCGGIISDLNPPTVGDFVIPFEPGLGIAAGNALNIDVGGAVNAEAFVDGYTVASSVVPSNGGATPTQRGGQH